MRTVPFASVPLVGLSECAPGQSHSRQIVAVSEAPRGDRAILSAKVPPQPDRRAQRFSASTGAVPDPDATTRSEGQPSTPLRHPG